MRNNNNNAKHFAGPDRQDTWLRLPREIAGSDSAGERLGGQEVVVVDGGLKVEPLDCSAEATQLSPNHAAQHATPRPVSQSVSQCMQSSDTPATGSPVEPAGATRGGVGGAGRCWRGEGGGSMG